MALTVSTPFMRDVYTVKKYGDYTYRIIYNMCLRTKGFEEFESPLEDWDDMPNKKGSVNSSKLSNNLSRAKSRVREYVLCNPWDYWCTFTINPNLYDRYDLKTYFKDFSKFIRNYNRYCNDVDCIKYLFVAEMHQDSAWHLHGFIKGIKSKDLYINDYGFLTWKQYEKKFGFISMSKIQNLEKASSYMLKYMTKDVEKNVTDLNAHLYYCSKGLKKADVVFRGNGIFLSKWDWCSEDNYTKILTVDSREVDIDSILLKIPF